MKGDQEFREKTKAAVQCTNEIYMYKKVIPYFKEYLDKLSLSSCSAYQWVPRIYFADYGVFEGLSEFKETLLALENLTPQNYRMGPPLDLDEDHLSLLITNIASYHAVNYALAINKDPMLNELATGLIPLSFLASDGSELESYTILFSCALQRFFTYVEKNEKSYAKEFFESIKKFKENSYKHPAAFMERFLKKDETFCVLLHGDYNRNNVLFQYDNPEDFGGLKAVKMIDFQEARFASPVIDIAFFMYMSLPPSTRPLLWDKLLKLYHDTLIKCMTELLKCEANDARLEPYNFEHFLDHFGKHACYGLMVSYHFLPWLLCPTEECGKISELFETDMKSDAFREILQICGGDKVDERLVSNALHAFEKGYLNIFD